MTNDLAARLRRYANHGEVPERAATMRTAADALERRVRLLAACLPALYEQRRRLMFAERRALDDLIEQVEIRGATAAGQTWSIS